MLLFKSGMVIRMILCMQVIYRILVSRKGMNELTRRSVQ